MRILPLFFEESSSRVPKKGSQRPFLLVSAKPICIHYNKKWKARAPSEKFERAPRLINFLWILYYLRGLYLPPAIPASTGICAALSSSPDDATLVAARRQGKRLLNFSSSDMARKDENTRHSRSSSQFTEVLVIVFIYRSRTWALVRERRLFAIVFTLPLLRDQIEKHD